MLTMIADLLFSTDRNRILTVSIMKAEFCAPVGVVTAVAMYLCGLGDPLLWGATAFLLNYIPILGPLFGTIFFLLAGMLSDGDSGTPHGIVTRHCRRTRVELT
jgi:predicted PurR-regulated permease PerM